MTHNNIPLVQPLISAAFAKVAGWEQKKISRVAWHAADDLMMQAALVDEEAVQEDWERLATMYEAWLHRRPTRRLAA